MMFDERLTENFELHEFLKSPGAEKYFNTAPMALKKELYGNILKLAKALQPIRTKVGCTFVITSGLRTPARNADIGGAGESTHLKGLGCDFTVPPHFVPALKRLMMDWPGGWKWYESDHHGHADVRGYRARW
jgi:uncharacterized protein YcbK (DUF882 family)